MWNSQWSQAKLVHINYRSIIQVPLCDLLLTTSSYWLAVSVLKLLINICNLIDMRTKNINNSHAALILWLCYFTLHTNFKKRSITKFFFWLPEKLTRIFVFVVLKVVKAPVECFYRVENKGIYLSFLKRWDFVLQT